MKNNINQDQFYDELLEVDILAILINSDRKRDEAMLMLEAGLFYNSIHIALFETIKSLWIKNEKITIETVIAFGKDVLKDIPNGISRTLDIAGSFVSDSGFETLVKKLKYYTVRRKIKEINKRIEDCFVEEKTNEEVISVISLANEYLTDENTKDNGSVEESLNEVMLDIDERIKNKGKIVGIPTKLTDLDEKINGLQESTMIIVAGRPGSGKTTLANNIALNVAESGKNVALFNLEMSKKQILEKMLSTVARIENEKIKKGMLDDKGVEIIGEATNRLLNLNANLLIFDSITYIEDIIAKCRVMAKRDKIDLLVIDYLQLLKTKHKTNNREQEIAYISRSIKMLANELKITVIALAQLSRSVEQRADKRPILSDLRESGSMEQDADIVAFCYRDEYYNFNSEDKNIIELGIQKYRNGPTGTLKFAWIPQFQRIGNLDLFRKPVTKPKKWQQEDEEFPF